MRFPEGVLYEDMTLVVTAYLAAKSFDVVHNRSYYWRVRNLGSSLSRRRAELKSLQDRLLSIEEIDQLLRNAISTGEIRPEVHSRYLSRILTLDLQLFAENFAETDESYFAEFHSRASKVLAAATPADWALASGKLLEVVRLAVQNDREGAIRELQTAAVANSGFPDTEGST